jgi:hypothetical protein
VQDVFSSDRNVLDLFDADFSYLDDRLAAHYGLPSPGAGAQHARVSVPPEQRAGVLTHGSFLSVTSHPRRTSPVKRGVFILEQLLCSTPPPPPPNVESLPEPVSPNASLRERFEAHRSAPACTACHATIDPLGFSLEHFDAIGRWRDDDGGFAIDASATLPDGTAFDGHRGLARVLRADPRVSACVTQKLMTYALGRGLTRADRCYVADVTAAATSGTGSFADYVTAVVTSEPFSLPKEAQP